MKKYTLANTNLEYRSQYKWNFIFRASANFMFHNVNISVSFSYTNYTSYSLKITLNNLHIIYNLEHT